MDDERVGGIRTGRPAVPGPVLIGVFPQKLDTLHIYYFYHYPTEFKPRAGDCLLKLAKA
ncbi:hypothetical protein [Paracidovorax avenae]|uniref:hypothetical protein n=1 Tax=Paracidovorax avenae TaxID=80867 RepID=UPI0018648BF0|nr:hypothetical protein [Paracidovorax avenae]